MRCRPGDDPTGNRLLEEEGLIRRQRAKGTFVLQRPQDSLWCDVRTDWSGPVTFTR